MYLENVDEYLCKISGNVVLKEEKHMMKFKLYVTSEMRNTPIEMLALSTRLDNALRRSKIYTVGDLLAKYKTTDQFYKMRGIGEKSVDDLMIALLDLQCSLLDEKGKEEYAKTLYEMNKEG